jgi:hypothetical protein
MDISAWAIVVTISIWGLGIVGTMIFFLGGMREKVLQHDEKFKDNDIAILGLTRDVNQLKGKVGFQL